MKLKGILYFTLITLFSFNLQSQDLSQAQVHEDFEYLFKALEEGHPGLYWFNSKKVFDQTKDKLETKLDGVHNVSQLQSLLVDINNTISCGHTAILLPEAHYKMVDSVNLFLPFNIVLVEDMVVVAESFTDELSKGDQIQSIDGEPIDKIISELERFIPIDKGITTKRDRSMEIIFPYYYAVYKGSPEKFNIETEAKGERFKREIEAIARNKKMYKSVRDYAPAQDPIELSFDATKQTTILKLATFSGQSFKQHEINFQDTIKSIFELLAAKKIGNLIIDLRWNNGGNMGFAEYLFSFFIDSTYRYYLDAEIRQPVMEGTTEYARSRNMLPMMAQQFGALEPKDGVYHLSGEKSPVEPTSPRFNGQLYLITNGLSFSATSAFITHIQENNIGQIVGETPGGAYDGLNAGPPMVVELPNSKIRLYYRIIGSRYNVKKGKVKTKVDVDIGNSYTSFMNGDDLQLDYILKQINK